MWEDAGLEHCFFQQQSSVEGFSDHKHLLPKHWSYRYNISQMISQLRTQIHHPLYTVENLEWPKPCRSTSGEIKAVLGISSYSDLIISRLDGSIGRGPTGWRPSSSRPDISHVVGANGSIALSELLLPFQFLMNQAGSESNFPLHPVNQRTKSSLLPVLFTSKISFKSPSKQTNKCKKIAVAHKL